MFRRAGSLRLLILIVSGLASVLSMEVAAQQPDTLRAQYIVQMPPTVEITSVARTLPGSSLVTPNAFGPVWGEGYVGFGVLNRQRYYPTHRGWRNLDGAVFGGLGFGNARDLVGLEVSLSSYSTMRRGFGNRGGVGVKAHRLIGERWGAAIGIENLLTRGTVDADETIYGVVTSVWGPGGWHPFRGVTTTVGVGNGRFRFEDDMRHDRNTVGVFGSVGLHVLEPVSLIADWTGQDLTLGASIAPFREIPMVIAPAVVDVLGIAGDGPRFMFIAGSGFRFANFGRTTN
jgi:hypothetical protein